LGVYEREKPRMETDNRLYATQIRTLYERGA